METDTEHELALCTDCLMIAANGSDSIEEDVSWPGIDDGWIVVPGHSHTLELCGSDVIEGTADCPFDEGYFSWSPCDACRRPEGGTRYPGSMFRILDESGYCTVRLASGPCNRPADHEIHDQKRAMRAGWHYHEFKVVEP